MPPTWIHIYRMKVGNNWHIPWNVVAPEHHVILSDSMGKAHRGVACMSLHLKYHRIDEAQVFTMNLLHHDTVADNLKNPSGYFQGLCGY